MLKHTSSRAELRTESDLDDSRDDLTLSFGLENSLSETPKTSERSLTDILPKPTIQKIIESRKSDLRDLPNHSKVDKLSAARALASSKQKYSSKESIHSTSEVIEELQLDNSTYNIHKRKRTDQKRNLSDTSTESGIDSQFSENSTKYKEEEQPQNKRNIIQNPPSLVPTNNWQSFEDLSAPPIAVSSPNLNKKIYYHNNNNYSTTNNQRSFDKEKKTRNPALQKSKHLPEHHHSPRNLKPYKQYYHVIERSHSRPASLHHLDTRGLSTERHSRPTSARSDNYRSHPYLNSRSLPFLSPNSDGHLLSQKKYASSCVIPSYNTNGSLVRNNTLRSISAGSSISNIPPQQGRIMARSVCSCDTMRHGLSDIKEENPIFNQPVPKPQIHKDRVRKARYVSIFFVIVAAISCLVGGFLHFYVGHFPESIRLNQGDVKLLPFSVAFCRGVRASSDDGKTRLITFTANENNDKFKKLSYTRSSGNFKIYPQQIWVREFYFVGGSEVNVTIETDFLLDIMVFKGDNSFSIWKNRKESDSYFKMESCCSNKYPKIGNINFTAVTTDRYYFVLYSRVEIIPISIKMLRMQFNRISYDFTDTLSSCNAGIGSECKVEYPFSSDNEVAIEVPLESNTNEISTSSSLKYVCVAREWFYFLFFFGIFIFLSCCIFGIYRIVIRTCIRSKQCCCFRMNKKTPVYDLTYYDNHGHMISNLYLNELPFDSVSHARSYAPSRRSEMKSTYDDSNSYVSRRSRAKHQASKPSSHVFENMGHTNDIATFYKDGLEIVEKADSGISMNPELSPSCASSLANQEIQATREQRYLDMRNGQRRFDLIHGPPVKALLTDRPHSITPEYNRSQIHHERYSSHPELRRNDEYLEREPGIFPDVYLQATPHQSMRSNSQRSQGSHHEYTFDNKEIDEELCQEENDIPMARISYDNREIFI